MRRWFLFLIAVAALGQKAHQHHPPRSATEYMDALENPEREKWQLPHLVVMALKLRPDEAIADIGAGTGYFSRRLAKHAGKVYAVDTEEKLLAALRKNAPNNVETVLASHDDPKLRENSVDTIFFCNVLHHIEGRPAYYAKLAKALKPGGRIVMIDFYKKPLPVGPPESMKLTEDDVIKELEAAGFQKVRQHEVLPYQYFLEFERK